MDIVPKKSLGQIFLKDKNIAEKISSSVNDCPEENVIEIGAGKGILTECLIKKFNKVYAIEIDNKLVDYLKKRFYNDDKLIIIQADFLKLHFDEFVNENEKVAIAGNIPYNLSSSILFKLFDERKYISKAVLMFQKEVAERIVCKNKNKGIISIITQFFGEPELLFDVKRDLFYPVPEVDSSVVKISFYHGERNNIEFDYPFFKHLVKVAFGKRRKMLKNSLKYIEGLDIKNIEKSFNLQKRPEELSVVDFIKLGNIIYKYGFKRN